MLGAVMANPVVRERRHAVPVGVTMDGMIVMEDDTDDRRPIMLKEAIEGPLVNMRNFGAPMVSDQQTDELKRYGGWGRPGYGGYRGGYGGMGGVGYGRPYGGRW